MLLVDNLKSANQSEAMINLSINLPKIFLKAITLLTDSKRGIYPSRSEFIRAAVRELLYKEMPFFEKCVEIEQEYNTYFNVETGEKILVPK